MEPSQLSPGLAQFVADGGTYWIRHPSRWEGFDVSEFETWRLNPNPIELPLGYASKRVALMEPTFLARLEQVGSRVWSQLDNTLSDHVVGYRFDFETNRIADYREPYLAEKERLAKQAISRPWVVKADILRFFRSVPISQITTELRSSLPESGALVELLDVAVGSGLEHLPPGSSTARVLANWWLMPVDSALEHEMSSEIWSRWLDDYTFLTRTKEDAERCLAVLAELLARRGLRLSSRKTSVLRVDSRSLPLGDTDLDSLGDTDDYDEAYLDRLVRKLHDVRFDGYAWRSVVRFCLGRLRAAQSDKAVDWVKTMSGLLRSEWRAVARYLAVLHESDSAPQAARVLMRFSRPTDEDWVAVLNTGALACYTRRSDVQRWISARTDRFRGSLLGQHAAVARAWMGYEVVRTEPAGESQWARLFREFEVDVPSKPRDPMAI